MTKRIPTLSISQAKNAKKYGRKLPKEVQIVYRLFLVHCYLSACTGCFTLKRFFYMPLTDRNMQVRFFDGISIFLRFGNLSFINRFSKKCHRLAYTASNRKGTAYL